MCQVKREEEEDFPALKTSTRKLLRKALRKTDYSHKNQYWRHEDQTTENNQKTKMGRKTTLWTFQTTRKRHLTGENVNVAKKRKP